ncbi:uncharacterized protein F4822DRAFT_292858 [Hypoxylon trugodes]|uniref:uncharacterized protein n=1 Tax=Hypoxylon trugodes TaxID=326681 RepID=UPI002195EBAC|nr:uncharacterized protein F4822DRAFT_292858 [Hypoxylon trugodes]KAI1387816.1 hypothetical protein F4822DRAFT_292858 [Hypoxylon trugodes]
MRFTATAALALFGASALAAPSAMHAARQDNGEDVSITEFAVHKAGVTGASTGTVDGVGFKLSGENATNLDCSATASQVSGLPTDIITCGDSKYRFELLEGPDSSTFSLKVHHELGQAVGFSGHADVPTYCHSGGLDNQVCSQVKDPLTIHIDSLPH